jgi:S1-C subfamily serine protease
MFTNLPHNENEPIGVPRGPNPPAGQAASTRFSRSVCQIKCTKVGTNWTQPYLNGKRVMSAGTGFVINHEGQPLVVTNDHVIRDASKIEAFFPQYGSQPFQLTIVADSPCGDMTLLRVGDAPVLDTLELADSDGVANGERLITVGFPLGQAQPKQSAGVKAGLQDLNGTEYIQTDAAINHGNSGGPLLRASNFAVVGINNCIIEGKNNVGYALPSATLKQFLSNYEYLKTDTSKAVRVSKPFFGFTTEKIDDSMLGYMGSVDKNGVLVTSVAPGSVFDAMGLRDGYQLLTVGVNETPRSINQFQECSVNWSATPVNFNRVLSRVKLGDTLSYEYYDSGARRKRNEKYHYTKVASDPRLVRPLYTPFDTPNCKVVAGLVLQELNLNLVKLYMGMNPLLAKYAALDAQCNDPAVVVTHVLEGSVAAARGNVAPSMVLHAVNGNPISNFNDLADSLGTDPVAYNKFELHTNVKLFVSNEEMVTDQGMMANEYGHYFDGNKAELLTVASCDCDCGGCGSCGGGHPAPDPPLPSANSYEVGRVAEAPVSRVVCPSRDLDDFELEVLSRALPSHLVEEFRLQ